jgi:hypothetical protein
MALEPTLRLIAGTFIMASVLLGMYVNPLFFWFTLFVGANLFQSGLTNWCPMISILRRLGLREGESPCVTSPQAVRR